MQAAGAPHLLQFLLQPDDALADQAPVGLDLRFAGAAEEAEAAALPLQVGPGPHQAGALVFQMRQLDLERAFPGGGALAEDVQDQAGAVDHLAGPGALQVALLHRRQRRIDDGDGDVLLGQRVAQRGDLPLAQQRGRAPDAQGEDSGMHDDEADRGGEADRLGQPRLGGAPVVSAAAELRRGARHRRLRGRARPRGRRRDPRARQWRRGSGRCPSRFCCRTCLQSPWSAGLISLSRTAPVGTSDLAASKSWMGAPGITVLMACL